jgi:mono/diheme cytochrome c family protein
MALALVPFAPCSAIAQKKDGPKAEPPAPFFQNDIVPFLKENCTNCHGGKRPRAELNLEKFLDPTSVDDRRDVWDKVVQNLRNGSMPPAFKKQPPAEQRDKVANWLATQLAQVDCTKRQDPGRITLRRLNRTEYNNTIRDLVGVDFSPAKDFPADDIGYGFDNIGDVLTLSPLLLEKYLAAAETIVDLAWNTPAARQRLFGPPPKKGFKRDNALTKEKAREILEKFARRAYRRPVAADEVDKLLTFVELAEESGDPVEKGVQLAVQAVLVSPQFLFRVEAVRGGRKDNPVLPVTDYELASRLSYFLWTTMPDDELFRLAEEKKLRAELDNQIKRMLADPRARSLTDNFAGQWLQLRNLANLTPDPELFPQFDEELRKAMVKETELFFEAVVKEDRSILDFIDADFTFVNERLAKHYGIPGIKGKEFRRVQLTGEQRGGILTQASVLSVTSNPTRTSPVKRGKWILDNILNTPAPPPPPNVPELSDDQQEVASAPLRQRMEKHRSKADCAVCHQRMDPLGFGLENYDAVGGWRTKDGKFDIDPSGELPGGVTFSGPKGLRAIVRGRESEFRRCLADKLLTYALGRGMESLDKCALDNICQAVQNNQNRFSALVLAIVHSDPFLYRKVQRGAK